MRNWRRRRAFAEPPAAAEELRVDFPACVGREFPHVFPDAWNATERVVALLNGAELGALEHRSPGLRGYDWARYLRCSVARAVRVLDALVKSVGANGRVLDVGSYFGNFSFASAARGFRVDAVDAYRAYGSALAPWTAALAEAGIGRLDFEDVGYDLHGLRDGVYDAVLLLGVIEHVAHSPRALLQAARRVLRPGGAIVLDTPNIAYAYHRERLARGESIMAPIQSQFDCDPPFEGHHREYTMDEVRWMLERVGFESVTLDAFNYSMYGLPSLVGDDLRIYREMLDDPSRRELVFATARAPHA